jgi:hypothetical protein
MSIAPARSQGPRIFAATPKSVNAERPAAEQKRPVWDVAGRLHDAWIDLWKPLNQLT